MPSMAGFFTPKSSKRHVSGGTPKLQTPSSNPAPAKRSSSRAPSRTRRSSNASANQVSGAIGGSSLLADYGLSLKRVIGCSTNAFDSHAPSRSFAYTAGAAAVVVTLDEDMNVSQRFFRARPNGQTLETAAASAGSNFVPSAAQQESRSRAVASLRDAGIGYTPAPPSMVASALADSPGGNKSSSKERIKAATCLSFSPDGKWLAVGETGYNPRILIFSMSRDVASDTPVAALSEHTFGVKDIAFSPCSRYLASIGTVNDGYVYIWSINTQSNRLVTLHASNKCTSIVRQIAWMGMSLVSVGTRFVKIWKPDEDAKGFANTGQRVLHGRNAKLGLDSGLIDAVWTCVAGIAEDKALVCSDKGEICVLDEGQLVVTQVAHAGFGIYCITVDSDFKYAWAGGKSGNIMPIVLKDILNLPPSESPNSTRSSSPASFQTPSATYMAMGNIDGHLFTLDSDHSLKVFSISNVDDLPAPGEIVLNLPAHKDTCLGVRVLPTGHNSGADFFTWSANGRILFWTLGGECKGDLEIELEQFSSFEGDLINELRVVRASKYGDFFVTGDKFGVLRVINADSRECIYDAKAHSSEITDIDISDDTIVSCSRDRIVQVFNRTGDKWNLAQTLDDHKASVSKVLLLEDGAKLVSCSADRTVAQRELCSRESADGSIFSAYLSVRMLTTKASPVHMTPISEDSNHILVSTMDRQIIKFDLVSGKSVSSFKPMDETGEAVVMDSIKLSREDETPRILVGTSTTDKSIRVYDLDGRLIDKEWGHTEGVSDVALFEGDAVIGSETVLISTGSDGTIMLWDFASRSEPRANNGTPSKTLPSKELTASRTPLRRVLSRGELYDLQKASGTKANSSTSPPRQLRRKASHNFMNRNFKNNSQLDVSAANASSLSVDDPQTPYHGHRRRGSDDSPITQDPSPIRVNMHRRTGSQSGIPTRPRKKSDAAATGPPTAYNAGNASINNATESLTRSLRSYRKKVESGAVEEGVQPDVLKALQKELALLTRCLAVEPDSPQESPVRERPVTANPPSRTSTWKSAISSRPNTSDGHNGPKLSEGPKLKVRGHEAPRSDEEREEVLNKLLGEYSERLMAVVTEKLDERFLVGGLGSSRAGSSLGEGAGSDVSAVSESGRTLADADDNRGGAMLDVNVEKCAG